jgi:hypothetical protein
MTLGFHSDRQCRDYSHAQTSYDSLTFPSDQNVQIKPMRQQFREDWVVLRSKKPLRRWPQSAWRLQCINSKLHRFHQCPSHGSPPGEGLGPRDIPYDNLPRFPSQCGQTPGRVGCSAQSRDVVSEPCTSSGSTSHVFVLQAQIRAPSRRPATSAHREASLSNSARSFQVDGMSCVSRSR